MMKSTWLKIKLGLIKFIGPIDRFLKRVNDFIINLFNQNHFVLMLIIITVLIMAAKMAFIPVTNGDTHWFLEPWMRFIRDHGGLSSIGEIPISYYYTPEGNIPYGDSRVETAIIEGMMRGNYPVFYYTILAAFSYLPYSNLAIIKIVSFLFDFALATGVMMVVSRFSKNKALLVVSYLFAFILPTFFINSAIWGQTDAVYGAMALWFIYFLMKDKPKTALIFIGLALTIKIQIIFILPIIGWLFLKKKFRLIYLFIPLAVVFISFLPNYIAGMPFMTPIKQYSELAGTYTSVNLNSGSMYAFLEGINSKLRLYVDAFGIPFAFVVLLALIYYVYHQGVVVNNKSLLLLGTLFAVLTPFLLPHMHERYFYMAEVFLLAYALTHKNRWHLAILSQLAGLITYGNFILGGWYFAEWGRGNLVIAAVINSYIIYALIKDITLLEKADSLPTKTHEDFS